MASKQRNEVLVGGFILLGLTLLVLLFFLKGTLGQILTPAGLIDVVFDDVRGLKAGDPVFFLGSKVGNVAKLGFERRVWGTELPVLFSGETTEVTRVRVVVQIDARVRAMVKSDSPVDIDKNLTGNISVLIRDGKAAGLQESGAVLRGNPGTELSSITDGLSRLFRKVDPIVEDVASLARSLSGSGKVDRVVDDVGKLTEGLRDRVQSLDGLIAEVRGLVAENRQDIRTISSNLAATTGRAQSVVEKLDPAADDLRRTLAQLEKTSGEAHSLLAENRPTLDAILEEIRSAVSNAANITADVRRRPWRLLHNPSADEIREQELYDSAWAYNLGAAGLERSLQTLIVSLGRDGDRAQPALKEAYQRVEESLRRHKEAEDSFWAKLQAR